MNVPTQAGVRLVTSLQEALDRPPEERGPSSTRRAARTAPCAGSRLEELLRLAEAETQQWQGGAALYVREPEGAYPWESVLLRTGQQLGRYEILDLLGAGGMGRVYRALDPSLGREVAIKALAHAFRGDSGSLRRFEREARVLAALSHPNIAAIYGLERLDGAPYLVLERVEGETLAQRLARGPMPLREAVAVALQVIEGLEEAHGKGVDPSRPQAVERDAGAGRSRQAASTSVWPRPRRRSRTPRSPSDPITRPAPCSAPRGT